MATVLKRIVVGGGGKSVETESSEASNSIKMGNMLKAYKMENGNNAARYVFFFIRVHKVWSCK